MGAEPGEDAGGFVSFKVPANAHLLPNLTAGGGAVLHPEEVEAACATATHGAAATRLTTGGPGVRWSAQGRHGAESPVVRGRAFVAEGFVVDTRHQIIGGEGVDSLWHAAGVDAGAVSRF